MFFSGRPDDLDMTCEQWTRRIQLYTIHNKPSAVLPITRSITCSAVRTQCNPPKCDYLPEIPLRRSDCYYYYYNIWTMYGIRKTRARAPLGLARGYIFYSDVLITTIIILLLPILIIHIVLCRTREYIIVVVVVNTDVVDKSDVVHGDTNRIKLFIITCSSVRVGREIKSTAVVQLVGRGAQIT